jgi:hypothetical protein
LIALAPTNTNNRPALSVAGGVTIRSLTRNELEHAVSTCRKLRSLYDQRLWPQGIRSERPRERVFWISWSRRPRDFRRRQIYYAEPPPPSVLPSWLLAREVYILGHNAFQAFLTNRTPSALSPILPINRKRRRVSLFLHKRAILADVVRPRETSFD